MANSKRSEDVYGEKLDRCLYNSLIKFVGGVGVGIVFSALLFRRRPWPIILGGGVGTGMGISDCNYEFKGTGSRPEWKTSRLASFFTNSSEDDSKNAQGVVRNLHDQKSGGERSSKSKSPFCKQPPANEEKPCGKSVLCKPKSFNKEENKKSSNKEEIKEEKHCGKTAFCKPKPTKDDRKGFPSCKKANEEPACEGSDYKEK